MLNGRKFKICSYPFELLRTTLSKKTPPDVWQTYDPSTPGSPYWFVFSISRYSAKFDCSPIFSDRLYCTSEGKALYEVKGILISGTVSSEWSKTNTVFFYFVANERAYCIKYS